MMKPILLIAALGAVATIASSASAMDGRDALASCTNNPKCRVHLDADGGMVIQVGGHVIYCPPQGSGDCEIVYRRGGHKIIVKALPEATAGVATAGAATPESLLQD